MIQRTKILSLYLLGAALVQIGGYVALTLTPEKLGALFYFDPRIGLFFIESGIRGAELKVPGILQWLSASWLLVISFFLLSGRSILKTYLVSEVVASLPNLFFFVVVVLANLKPAHGFSIGELFLPVVVMILFTILPLILAVLLWRRNARENNLVPARAELAVGADSP